MRKIDNKYIVIMFWGLMLGLLSPIMAAAPGGVTSDLDTWLRSDTGHTARNNSRVNKWTNSLGVSFTSSSGPIYQTNGLNFHPKLNFSGEELKFNEKWDSTRMQFYSVQKTTSKSTLISWDQDPYPYPDVTYPLTVYNDINYNGASQKYRVGDNNNLGSWNDRISSFKLSAGYLLTIYQHSSYFGKKDTLWAPVDGYNFANIGNTWNDEISSFKLSKYMIVPSYAEQYYQVEADAYTKYISNISPYQTNIKIGGLTGDVYEIIAYAGGNNFLEKNKIRSYLHLKYGLLMEKEDYINSSGQFIMTIVKLLRLTDLLIFQMYLGLVEMTVRVYIKRCQSLITLIF